MSKLGRIIGLVVATIFFWVKAHRFLESQVAQWRFCVWDPKEAELVLVTVALPGARFGGFDLDLFRLVNIHASLVAR